MIALIRGTLRQKSPGLLVIEASGVGYEILCTQDAFERAPGIGEEYEVLTRLIVREDSMTLFGFSSMDERHLFDQVIGVSGIGPKTGIAILSGLGSARLREAIRGNDLHALVGIPGIGRKTAERLVLDLRDKLLKEDILSPIDRVESGSNSQIRSDALQALISLGYGRSVAETAIREVIRATPEAAKKVETLVKAALREAAK